MNASDIFFMKFSTRMIKTTQVGAVTKSVLDGLGSDGYLWSI